MLPTLTVEVAFDSEPLDTTPTWTAISSKADDISITIGKQSQLDVYQPGTASMTLDNRDRRFDPTHTTGPYYSGSTKVLPRKKLRIKATWAGIEYELYTGFVDGWPQRPAGLAVSDIQIGCTDLFGILANIELPTSVYAYTVSLDEPDGWWRMNEDKGSDLADSSAGDHDGTYLAGQTELAGRHPNPWETTTAVNYDGVHRPAVIDNAGAILTARPVTIEWMVTAEAGSETIEATLFSARGPTLRWAGTYNREADTNLWGYGALVRDGSATNNFVTISGIPTDGRGHHLAYRMPAAGDSKIYYDGVEVAGFPSTSNSVIPGNHIAINANYDYETDREFPMRGAFADLAVYASDIGTTKIAEHAAAMLAPWEDDTTGERVERLAVIAGLASSQYDIDLGKSLLGSAVLGGTALEKMREVEATEQGYLYVDHAAEGKLRFDDRHARLTASRSTTVQATFSDETTPGTLHWEAGSIELLWDWQLIYNEVTVNWAGGADVTVIDAASIAAYGRRSYSVSTQSRTAAEARDLAEWILNHYREPIVRIRSLVLNPAADSTTAVAALSLRVGDLVEVKIKPQNTGTRITYSLLVEGKTHHFDKTSADWTTTLYLSPADTQPYGIWGAGLWGTAVWGY